MSAYMFARGFLLTGVLIAASGLAATAQPKVLPPEAPAKAKLGPGVHDDGGIWADAVRQSIKEVVRNLYADYRCYVLIETYDGVPAQAGEVDLSDPSAVDQALNARRNELAKLADRRNTVFSLILVQSKRGHRFSCNMSYPAFGKEEGEHIVHEVVHRLHTRNVPDALSYLRLMVAGKPAPSAEGNSTQHNGGSFFHDGAGWWTAADQAKLQRLAADIMRRYKCKVFIETRPTLPARLARGQDLSDHIVADRLFSTWANPRSAAVSSKDGLNINLFACAEIHMFGVRINWLAPDRRWTKEERALADKLNVGLNQRLAGKFAAGMVDALAFVRDTLEESRALVARAPAASLAPATAELHPSPELPPAAGDQAEMFRAAAKEGGMSAADIDAVLADRSGVSYEALTDFTKEQIKEGRTGNDLKDDLLTFIKLLKAK